MISPNYTILKPTVFVLTSIYAKVFEKRWRSQKGHVTSHQGQSIKNQRGTHGTHVPQIWCNSDYYLQSYGILKKMAHGIFLWSAPSWKCQSNHTGFQTYPSPKWKMADPRNFGPIRAFFIELSC